MKTVSYEINKETKGAVRYTPILEGSGYGDIYIRKEVLTKPYPSVMKVTFELGVK